MQPNIDTLNFIRVASVAPELRVADVQFNVEKIRSAMGEAVRKGVSIVLFPELCITGSTCADLFSQTLLLGNALKALQYLANETKDLGIHAIVGLPINLVGRLYNCAAFIAGGEVLGIVPKRFLPTTNEFYEQRWFSSGERFGPSQVKMSGLSVPFGQNLLFAVHDPVPCILGIEICEDLWAVEPPSGGQALSGANIIFNPSASNELIGKNPYRKDLVKMQSARCVAGYVYASAGPGESSTDVVYSGHCLIGENGVILAESERFRFETQMILGDIDLDRLRHDRLRHGSFSFGIPQSDYRMISCPNLVHGSNEKPLGIIRPHSPTPFIPSDPCLRATICQEIFAIQTTGLIKRLKHVGAKTVVIGISGGLDSTLALLVAIQAFDGLALDRGNILTVTMPGLGTSQRTKSNAEELAKLVEVGLKVIPIHDAVNQHFRDIEHSEEIQDVTYENAQARERTQVLMNLANKHGGFVVGTGDLSEAAMGWCTFNGDHISMYHVNIGVPKTLVRFVIEWCAEAKYSGAVSNVLHQICDTPISPELLPVGEDGDLEQMTEKIIGPYELHDFFLFHLVRHGQRPSKILYLAELAFQNRYDRETILHWLEVFLRRFFNQQFKRSVMPDGPKIGSVALSPRGDWRMPSDASAEEWLTEVKSLVQVKS